jgi:hypothetical protein
VYTTFMKLPVQYNEIPITDKWKVREEYVKRQNGNCWHCKEPLKGPPAEATLRYKINLKWFPEGFMDNPVHLQHNHDTGLTEGAVHAYCNAVLWEYFGR